MRLQALADSGYCFADYSKFQSLRQELNQILPEGSGVRNLLDDKALLRTRVLEDLRELATRALGAPAFAVRAILFDKTAHANWKVPFHQDLSIAIAKRHHVEGFGPWSIKSGVEHVQPPLRFLERMVALRLHLDDCAADCGPLRVLVGTHRAGVIAESAIDDWTATAEEATLTATAGQVLLMRPLLLHASSARQSEGRRRILHVEFAVDALPPPLEWRWRH